MVLTLRFASPQTWERLTDDSPLEITLVKGSGNPALDRHAQEVARSAGPFGAFTPEMRNSLDQLVVVARFSFTRDEALRTEALGAP